MAIKVIEVDGETFAIRKFSLKDYLDADLGNASTAKTMVSVLAMGLANADGGRMYPQGADITPIENMPFSTANALAASIIEFNGMNKENEDPK